MPKIKNTYRVHYTTSEALADLAFVTGEDIVIGGGYASLKVQGVEWRCELDEVAS